MTTKQHNCLVSILISAALHLLKIITMRPNLPLLKLVIRLLILLILLVMLFIISAFLYSAKYWPDVYNYINANITIKRIPTISELRPVLVYEIDYTTELYSTTDSGDYLEATTDPDDFNLSFDDFMNDDDDKRRKRQIPIEEIKINFETIKANYDYDYIFDIEITTKSFLQDVVNVDKLTTGDPEYFEVIAKTDDYVKDLDDQSNMTHLQTKSEDGIHSVFQWIAAVFVMNSESNRFEYVCDGALVSEMVVLTAARCVIKSNMTGDGTNVLIILGKRSLQSMGPNEKVIRVKSIKIHDNFNSTEEEVDLAGLVLAESVITNVDIQPALLGVEDKSGPLAMATTGWHVTGPLQPLYLGPITAEMCVEKSGFNNTICAVLSDSETTCPSFGGLLVDRQDDNQWRLKGIATGDPTTNGVCFNKNLVFTRIGNYLDWISKIEANK